MVGEGDLEEPDVGAGGGDDHDDDLHDDHDDDLHDDHDDDLHDDPPEGHEHQPPPSVRGGATEPYMPPSTYAGAEVPMPTRSTRGPLTGTAVSEVAKTLAALHGRLKFRVSRDGPKGLPDAEYGLTEWEVLPDDDDRDKLADNIIDRVREQHGGGTYVVYVQSTDLERPQAEKIPVRLNGDFKPCTEAGREYERLRNAGVNPAQVMGGTMLSGGTNLQPIMDVMREAMRMASEDRREDRRADERSKDRKDAAEANEQAGLASVVAALIQSQNQPGAGAQLPTILTALSPVFVAVVQSNADNRARMEEAAQRRHEQMIEMMRNPPQSAGLDTNLELLRSVLGMHQKGAEVAMDVQATALKGAMERAMEMAGLDDSAAGPLRQAVADVIANEGPNLLRMGMGMLDRVVQPPGSAPALGAGSEPSTAPLPEGEGGEAAPPADGSAPPPPDPVELGEQIALASLGAFLYAIMVHSAQSADPEVVWDTDRPEITDRTLDDLFGQCPLPFRERMAGWREGELFSMVTFTDEWHGDQLVQQNATRIDEMLTESEDFRGWFKALLDAGPWHEDEDEPAADPGGGPGSGDDDPDVVE